MALCLVGCVSLSETPTVVGDERGYWLSAPIDEINFPLWVGQKALNFRAGDLCPGGFHREQELVDLDRLTWLVKCG